MSRILNWTPKYLKGTDHFTSDMYILAENQPGVWTILVYPDSPTAVYPLNAHGVPNIFSKTLEWEEIDQANAFYYKICCEK
jgi:hypothetical protein